MSCFFLFENREKRRGKRISSISLRFSSLVLLRLLEKKVSGVEMEENREEEEEAKRGARKARKEKEGRRLESTTTWK